MGSYQTWGEGNRAGAASWGLRPLGRVRDTGRGPPKVTRLIRIKMAVAGVLGIYCAVCGCMGTWNTSKGPHTLAPLQVGHPNGRKWSIRRLNTLDRWRRYLKEALAGKVQAECGPCNRKHGGGLRYKRVDRTRQGGKRHG